ncbi:GNAT family N-acetyltransferase [Geotalea toluenoxydans]|uniref:GNAT family N-acetyltransferase n=1 Tax=Geotalea toluenoxydans TaxID=421624 RepID=UPI0006D059F3|nr:GNAT family N-acetyltransferase [Geotalea toluenoxydans]
MSNNLLIRNALPSDLEAIISLDRTTPDADKADYWQGIFEHYVVKGRADRIFLVAEKAGTVIGFIVGEVRAWEFGSPPCGWVFALAVSPDVREQGTGKKMWDEICSRLKKTGVSTVRTMANLDQKLTLSFLRSMGLRTGRYIELEKQLD